MRHSGRVSVIVLGDEVVTPGGQTYSLVITGAFESSATCPEEEECPLCLNGECVDGECQCEEGWEGPSCGDKVSSRVVWLGMT